MLPLPGQEIDLVQPSSSSCALLKHDPLPPHWVASLYQSLTCGRCFFIHTVSHSFCWFSSLTVSSWGTQESQCSNLWSPGGCT